MYETPCVRNPTATPVTWFRLKPVPPRIPTVNMGVDQIQRTQVSEVSGEDDNATLPQTLAVFARCHWSSTVIPRSHGRQIQLTSPDRHRYRFTGMSLRSLPPASTSGIHTSTTSTASPCSMPYPPHHSYILFGHPLYPAPAFSHPDPQTPSHHSTPTHASRKVLCVISYTGPLHPRPFPTGHSSVHTRRQHRPLLYRPGMQLTASPISLVKIHHQLL